jgi:hypothetical protein
LFVAGYRVVIYTSRPILFFSSVDIIEGESGVKGVLLTSMLTRIDDAYSLEEPIQVYDAGGTVAHYFLMDDIEKSRDFKDIDRYLYGRYTDWGDIIRISASPCLIDPNMPLRYSLQNAFDGDLSTSYVENTENDLFELIIRLQHSQNNNKLEFNRLSIINGYALSKQLYEYNNRLKNIVIWSQEPFVRQEIILLDNMLLQQIIYLKMPTGETMYSIKVESCYPGSKYLDTCVAEINMELQPNGWLFGDIDE